MLCCFVDFSGKRGSGRGLWSFLVSYLVEGVGVWGYDPVQGALSPPLRLALHASVVLLLWAAVVSSAEATASWSTGGAVLCVYSLLQWIVHHVLPGVSIPGGPRAHKIDRHPQWPDRTYTLPKEHHQWTYACAEDSHAHSQTRFQGTGAALTGEPFGRDIWTHSSSSKASRDDKLVDEYARGGRSSGGFNPSVNPNSCDVLLRSQLIRNYIASGHKPPSAQDKPKTVAEATRKAVHFYSMLQTSDGHWSGDYGGPHFLMPGLVVAWYMMGRPSLMLDDQEVAMMQHYIRVHQQVDGGWGTHIESPSTMFGTVLNYVALRLLGGEAQDEACVRGRKFIQDQGGALTTSSWAKFYLCLLGVMEWDGHNSVPPELWLLPNWIPFHPGRMWCHARMVYLPMGYLYGARVVYDKAESDPLIHALREELYCEPYDNIDWINTRHLIAPMDNYSPIPITMKVLQNILACYETWTIFQPFKNYVREKGLAFCIDYMAAEDLQTNFIDIGPVNKVMNMLSAYHHAGGDLHHSKVMNHLMRVPDYLWMAEDGLKMKGYNGSQCWDTSFAIQAIYESELLDEFPEVSKRVWAYLERCQILSTEISQATPAYKYESAKYRRQYYRHISEGGWPFSTSAHGWPITDCTGEGLKGVLCLLKSEAVTKALGDKKLKPISETRLEKSIEVLLSYQNEDGGFATYENTRGFGWYESLNPSEVFGDIMIDYSYVECSMASLTALSEFHEAYPKHRPDEIRHALDKGREFLKTLQREDGSWYGSWACCFCYAGWFGIEGLIKCGEPTSSLVIRKACEYFLSKQRANGGWGEDFTSCYDKSYAVDGMKAYGDEGSSVVNTAWALLALSMAKCEDVNAVKRGIAYLMKRQLPSGDWPQEGIAGVFNRSCGITYTAYRNVFPIWAMGRCRAVYGSQLDE